MRSQVLSQLLQASETVFVVRVTGLLSSAAINSHYITIIVVRRQESAPSRCLFVIKLKGETSGSRHHGIPPKEQTLTYTPQTLTQISTFRGYLLITNGPRHLRPIEDHPAAQHQLFVLKTRAAEFDAKLAIVTYDYARKIRSFDDLPNLFEVLDQAKQIPSNQPNPHHIFIDDYARLFRVTAPEFRSALWNALLEHAAFITDLRQGKPLDEVSEDTTVLIRAGLLPRQKARATHKSRSKQDREAQTAAARRVSAASRSLTAARSAQALRQAYDSYLEGNQGTNFRGFIEGDAALGLRNSRGALWTYRSGLRAIKSLNANARKDR